MIRRIFKFVLGAVAVMAAALFAILLFRAFDARNQADLELWHKVGMKEEFRYGKQELASFSDYLALEQRVGHTIFLDGNTRRDSHSIDRDDLGGAATVGLAYVSGRRQISFAARLPTGLSDGGADDNPYG